MYQTYCEHCPEKIEAASIREMSDKVQEHYRDKHSDIYHHLVPVMQIPKTDPCRYNHDTLRAVSVKNFCPGCGCNLRGEIA